MRAFVLAILTGCATAPQPSPADHAAGMVPIAPPPGDLALTVQAFAPGHLALFQVDGATPGATVHVVASTAGTGDGPCPDALAGGCLEVRAPVLQVATGIADADGHVTLVRELPAGLDPAGSAGLQAVETRRPAEAATSYGMDAPLDLPVLPPLAGQWTDTWDGTHTITRRGWSAFGSTHAIVEVTGDADAGTLIARNGDDNPYFPGLWSRFDHVVDDAGQVWFCQQAYAEASYADAVAFPAPDASDPAAGGCGVPPFAFAWTPLEPAPFALAGEWVDEWGTAHSIDATTWSTAWGTWHITELHAADGWLVAQNDAGNDFFPEAWSRYDWTWRDDHLYYCQTEYGAISEAAAALAPAPDDADPAVTGCGGFAWTDLTP